MKACHDFNNDFTLFTVPVLFIMYTNKDSNLISMYSEVLIAKYGGSRMNDAHTISLANSVSLPEKVVWLTAFFLKKEIDFVVMDVSHSV